MARRNRVTPLGELIADPARGLVYGNRGCLHDRHGRIRRPYDGKRWIACRLQFRGWHREPLMAPGRFTELFFLDEATALAAGHRPCALCRRDDYRRLVAIWAELHPDQTGADAIDTQLHAERISPARLTRGLPDLTAASRRPATITRERRYHQTTLDDLPDGAFVVCDGAPWLVRSDELLGWTPTGYVARRSRPAGQRALLVTPPSLVAVLRGGWQPLVPLLHPSAG
jgi:hypothetical protein